MADRKYLTVPHLDSRTLRRIFSKIVIDPDTGCWLWKGALIGAGYGHTFIGGRNGIQVLTHRLMYAWLVAPVPRGRSGSDRMVIHHKCEVTHCCNPAHLELVTHEQNVTVPTSVSVINSLKTHCPKGHPLDGKKNLRTTRGRRVSRFCSACNRARAFKNKALARYAIEYLRARGIVPTWNGREFVD